MKTRKVNLGWGNQYHGDKTLSCSFGQRYEYHGDKTPVDFNNLPSLKPVGLIYYLNYKYKKPT